MLSVMILTHHLRKDTSISSTSVLGLSSRSFRMQSGLRRLGRRLYAPIDQRARRRRGAAQRRRRRGDPPRTGAVGGGGRGGRWRRWWRGCIAPGLRGSGAGGGEAADEGVEAEVLPPATAAAAAAALCSSPAASRTEEAAKEASVRYAALVSWPLALCKFSLLIIWFPQIIDEKQ